MHTGLLALFLACSGPTKGPSSPDPTPLPSAAAPLPSAGATATASAPAEPTAPGGACLPDNADDHSLSGKDLNTLGYRCYMAGDLAGAHRLFVAAVDADDDNALAHYNLACTLALLRARGEICEYDAYEETILDHLERAVALDPGRRERMKEDADLDGLRSTVRYQALAGADLSDEGDLERVLEQATFWGPAAGVYGNTSKLDLQPDHVAVLERMTVGDDGAPVWTPDEGRWTVRSGRLEIEIGQESWTYDLSPDGSLVDRTGTAYMNHRSECSA